MDGRTGVLRLFAAVSSEPATCISGFRNQARHGSRSTPLDCCSYFGCRCRSAFKMAAAFQTLTHQETPKATSALNVVQRIGGAIGTAVLAIVLQQRIAAGHSGIQGLASLPPLAVQGTKRALNQVTQIRAGEVVEAALLQEMDTLASDDLLEAIAAFQEKRSATFSGN